VSLSLYDLWSRGVKMYRSCQKHVSLSLYDLSTCHHLFVVLFITSSKPYICTAITTQKITKITVLSHTQEA
jgi:hypothetical protein